MFKETNPKLIKYTNKEIVICLMKEVGERVALKERKVLIPWEEQMMYALQF